jgi:hypothetical protein
MYFLFNTALSACVPQITLCRRTELQCLHQRLNDLAIWLDLILNLAISNSQARFHPNKARSHLNSAISHPNSARSHPHTAISHIYESRFHPQSARSHLNSARSIYF